MVAFTIERLLAEGPASFQTGISDLDIYSHGGRPVLYATSGPSGGVLAYALDPGGPALLDSDPFGPGTPPAAPGRLEQVETAEGPVLVSLGRQDTAPFCFELDGQGRMTGTGRFQIEGAVQGSVMALETVSLGGAELVYTSHLGGPGLVASQVGASGAAAPLGAVQGAPLGDTEGPAAIQAVESGGATVLLALSTQANRIDSYRLDAEGVPHYAASLGAADGLGIAQPTALAEATVAGKTYAVVAAAGSSSLSVLEVGADGALSVTDHVLDSLNTRFANVQALESVTVAGQVYLIAGGSDDGLSLFSLLPGGRLLHRAQIADSLDTALTNISALALSAEAGRIEVFATGETEAGVSHLSVDPGTLGAPQSGGAGADTLTGTAGAEILDGRGGDDMLSGGAGDDILIDGAGSDRLRGGAGADIFVLSRDGAADRVLDFQFGVDRLDLSAFGLIHTLGQLALEATANGATVRYGGETVHLVSASGGPLEPGLLSIGDLVDMAHYAIAPPPPPPPILGTGAADRLMGTPLVDRIEGGDGHDVIDGLEAGDELIGGGGDDRIFGRAGNDRLQGGEGRDVLRTGSGDDRADGGAGNDRLYGNLGLDRLEGGTGEDLIRAGAGDDQLSGGRGADRLYGNGGADEILGGTGQDLLVGGNGHDRLSGGDHDDVLRGSSGRDVLDGGSGADTLTGDGGRDTLLGGAGDDRLDGGLREDLLDGGAGADTLAGGAGPDTLLGGNGADRLSGGAGRDVLDGGAGADLLEGGGGPDVFVFRPGFGQDTVTDFTPRGPQDRIDLSALSTIRDFADLAAHHLSARGGDAVIDAGGGDRITLEGVGLAELEAGDFLF